MKNIIVALGLFLALSGSAHAAADTIYGGATRVPEASTKITVVRSSNTSTGLDISSQTAVSVITDTTQMFSQVCVQNFDTSAFLACSENVNVSTRTAQNHVGTIIAPASSATAPAAPTCFSIVPGYNFYCRTASVTSSTRAGITRVR